MWNQVIGLQQRQKRTVLDLHKAGILPEVIAMQLDMSKEEVVKIIINAGIHEEKKRMSVKIPEQSLLGMFYLDAIVNIDNIIRSAQFEMWKSLKGEMEFNISTEDTQDVLANAAESKVTLAILYIDIVGSTKLSMTLPVDKLAAIVRAFTHEMSVVVSAYGGYVLKYLGDAVLAFFVVHDRSDLYIPCINAVHCGRSMIRGVQEGFNPILSQGGYPELSVRVGIDVGEVAVVQYGWNVQSTIIDGSRQVTTKKALYDILGYTISVASKITSLAEPNKMVIGQYVYEALDKEQKDAFVLMSVPPHIWSYLSSKTGNPYKLYSRSKSTALS